MSSAAPKRPRPLSGTLASVQVGGSHPRTPFERFAHIVVEGPIGVGKTSLARALALRYGVELLLEAPQDNPFLARFYRDGERWAFPTQLHFLFQRIDQLREIGRTEQFNAPVVSDFLIDKDALFARLTLDDEELALYERIAEAQSVHAPIPDLVIYLQASAARLVERVARRGVSMERDISPEYLDALSAAYTRFFHHYDAAPLMIVNTDHLNPVDRAEDFELLLEQLIGMRGRRAFFSLAE